MREIIAEKTDGDPKWAIVTRTRQINQAVGIEGINKCDPAYWPFVAIGQDLTVKVYQSNDTQAQRKPAMKKNMDWLKKIKSEFEELTKPQKELAAA